MPTENQVQYLERDGKPKLAYMHTPASEEGKALPMVVFLGGYRSDMQGTKATYFEAQCKERGQAYLRLDYSGHGQSEGEFDEGTISIWMQDALDVINHVKEGSVILVGSSMGGWIGFLIAQGHLGMVDAFIGIAAAPDFTDALYERLSEEQRKEFEEKGRVGIENDYSDEPYAFTREIYQDGKKNFILNKTQSADYTIRLFQGMLDKDVPWETAVKIQKIFDGADADIIFIDEGDHSLSRPEDLDLINKEIESLSQAG